MQSYDGQACASGVDFLKRVHEAAPMKIVRLLTDLCPFGCNGTQFTDRFTGKDKRPTGNHCFDQACAELGIEHRLSPPRHPQTNGMVERFNGRVSATAPCVALPPLCPRGYASIAVERIAQANPLQLGARAGKGIAGLPVHYNEQIPQRVLHHQTPLQAIQKWQGKKPELFAKPVHNQAGLDTFKEASNKLLNS